MGISIREFARRDGCDEKLARRAIKTGRLHALPDGTLDPALIGTGWRKANRRKPAPAAASSKSDPPAPADLEQLADQVVNVEGRAPYTLIEAERIKANYLALLRQLQYDRESGAVVAVDEVTAAVAAEYGIVRNNLLGLPARVAPRLAHIRDAEQVRTLLHAEICKLLEDLALDSSGLR
jgi:hypothetical protein